MIAIIDSILEGISRLVGSIQWYDIVDIALVAIAVYYGVKIIRQTRAFQLVKGLILVGAIYAIVSALNMGASTFLFNQLFSDIVIVVILLFQPEIRHAVESLGRGGKLRNLPFFSSRTSKLDEQEIQENCSAIAKAMYNMSDSNIGALIVIESQTPLGEITSSGSKVDCAITTIMLENIFFPKAPLHDGAVVIKDNRIHSAGCILPLSSAPISKNLGTRHRAALGMSEASDALVLVVSEETGNISVAQGGTLESNITRGELLETLTSFLTTGNTGSQKPFKILRRRNNERKE